MKKQVLALALLCCCLIGFAKDKRPINYRFHKNDTINFLSTTERDGSTSSSKYQVVVLESKGKKALLKFNVLSFGDEIEEDSTPTDSAFNFIQNKEAFLEMFKSKMVSPIIQFEKGEAKKIVNFEEQKASMKELMNVILNEYSKNPKMNQDKPMNDSILVFIKNFMMPMVDEFLTEEMFLKDYSSIVLNDIPQKLGEFNKNDGKTILQSSLTATQIAGEYAFRQICKMELSKEDLKNSERKDNPVVNMISNMGLGGKLMLAFVDSMQFETTKSGVVYSNGLPKHFVEETRVSFSAMGKKKEMITKQTVSIIEK